MRKITNTRSKTTIALTPADIEQAIRVYVSGQIDVPEGAYFDIEINTHAGAVEAARLWWTNHIDPITEEIS